MVKGSGKPIALIFAVVFIGLFSALVVPELFNNLVNQQTNNNKQVMQSLRIIIMIFVMFTITSGLAVIIGDF